MACTWISGKVAWFGNTEHIKLPSSGCHCSYLAARIKMLWRAIHCCCDQLINESQQTRKCVFLWCTANRIRLISSTESELSVILGSADARCTPLLLPSDQFTRSMGENIFTPTPRSMEKGCCIKMRLVYPKIFNDSYLQYRGIWCMQYFNWGVIHTVDLVNCVIEWV